MKTALLITLVAVFCCVSHASFGKDCSSIAASYTGGWKPISTTPRDGSPVELLETYGVAPWYGLFRWNGRGWEKVGDPHMGVSEDECLFWRPFEGEKEKYVDPTGGAQDTVDYWCRQMKMRYDKKTDSCK